MSGAEILLLGILFVLAMLCVLLMLVLAYLQKVTRALSFIATVMAEAIKSSNSR